MKENKEIVKCLTGKTIKHITSEEVICNVAGTQQSYCCDYKKISYLVFFGKAIVKIVLSMLFET